LKVSRLSPNLLYHFIFLLLAVAAVLFYQERLFVDSSYYIFKSINEGWFHIEHGRSVLALSQIAPLLGKALAFSLKTLLIMYSLGQIVFFYLIFLLMQHHLKVHWAGVAILSLLLIAQKWLFFIPMLEISWGALLAILVLGIMRYDRYHDDKWLLIMLFSWWFVLTSHPLNYLLSGLILAYDVYDRGVIKRVHYSLFGFFLASLFLELIGSDTYENQKIVDLQDSMFGLIIEPAFLKAVFQLLVVKYWLPFLLGVIASIQFLRRKRWLAALAWPTSIGLILAAALYRWDISQDDWYTEVILQPMIGISLLLFTFSHLERFSPHQIRRFQWAYGFLLLGYSVSIFYWAKPRQQRTAHIERATLSADFQKAIVSTENFQRDYHQLEWSMPVEALLISACKGADKTVSLITELDMAYDNHRAFLHDSSFVFRRFERMPYAALDKEYFHLKKGNYQSLNSVGGAVSLKGKADQITISPLIDKALKVPSAETTWVDVKLVNQTDLIMPSKLNTELSLAAHWYHQDTLYRWDGPRTLLLADCRDSLIQDMRLLAPEEKGIYEVQFDIVKEKAFWLGLKEKFTVQVY